MHTLDKGMNKTLISFIDTEVWTCIYICTYIQLICFKGLQCSITDPHSENKPNASMTLEVNCVKILNHEVKKLFFVNNKFSEMSNFKYANGTFSNNSIWRRRNL